MSLRKLLLWTLVVAICCTAGGAAVYLPLRAVPPISAQVPEGLSHLGARIISPMRDSRWPLNSFVPVVVQAQSLEPIARVELFVNGTALEPQVALGTTPTNTWMWQPGAEGDFVLTARVTGKSGLTGVSVPVVIHAAAAGHTVSPVVVQPGQTLREIAAEKGLPIQQLEAENPGVGADVTLELGKHVMIPNTPQPITNTNLIEPLQPGSVDIEMGGNAPSSGSPGQPPELTGPTTSIVNDLGFWLQNNSPTSTGAQSKPQYPPAQPLLFGDFKGCEVHVWFGQSSFEDKDPKSGWMGWEEDGFFVYRSRDGGPNERIATLPPIHEWTKLHATVDVTESNQYGTLTYYVSSFNALGEVASNPLTFALNPGTCPAPSAAGDSGIRMDPNGDIVLPMQMDMAYFYLQINGSAAARVPEGNRMFLPGSGIRFNLYDYIGTLGEVTQAADLKMHLEVWGWQGGNLVYVGPFDTELHRSVLSICSVPGESSCSNGNGTWVTTLNLPHDTPLKDLTYEMRWQVTNLTEATGMILTVSESPLPASFSNSQGLLYHSDVSKWMVNGKYLDIKDNEGMFPLDLGNILYPDPPPPTNELGWNNSPSKLVEYRTVGFTDRPPGQPFTLYVHVLAHTAQEGYEHESNSVTVLYDTTVQPAGMPPLASPYSSLYTLDILEEQFKPASHYEKQFAEEDLWGCVVVDEDPTGTYVPGSTICPGKDAAKTYYHQDDCAGKVEAVCLLEGLGNAVGFLWDNLKLAYELMKGEIAAGISYVIPGCNDEELCTKIVRKAVDYGVSYVTGIPSDLPSSEELIADSVSTEIIMLMEEAEKSYTGMDESALGQLCKQVLDCKEKLKEVIQTELKQAKSVASQPACIDSYQAYFHGQAPFCLDPRIVVHPAPGATESPAVVLVRVTRNNTPGPDTGTEDIVNALSVEVSATSADSSKQTDAFLKPNRVNLPPLKPGESLTVPVTLQSLWLEKYYIGGTMQIRAAELCYSPGSTWDWVPCKDGGSDTAQIPVKDPKVTP